MYDALLAGAAGVSTTEQDMLRAVRAQVAGWRLRKRFAGDGAEAYRKATAFEALVRPLSQLWMEPSSPFLSNWSVLYCSWTQHCAGHRRGLLLVSSTTVTAVLGLLLQTRESERTQCSARLGGLLAEWMC